MTENALEKADKVFEVAELFHVKGMRQAAISKKLGLSDTTVKKYLDDYDAYIKDKALNNQDLFDKHIENTFKFLEEYDVMIREMWDVYDQAKDMSVVGTQLQAMDRIERLKNSQARLHQLFGQRVDTSYIERAKRAEKVNAMISGIIRTVVADCPRCRPMVASEIENAMMGAPSEEMYEDAEYAEPETAALGTGSEQD